MSFASAREARSCYRARPGLKAPSRMRASFATCCPRRSAPSCPAERCACARSSALTTAERASSNCAALHLMRTCFTGCRSPALRAIWAIRRRPRPNDTRRALVVASEGTSAPRVAPRRRRASRAPSTLPRSAARAHLVSAAQGARAAPRVQLHRQSARPTITKTRPPRAVARGRARMWARSASKTARSRRSTCHVPRSAVAPPFSTSSRAPAVSARSATRATAASTRRARPACTAPSLARPGALSACVLPATRTHSSVAALAARCTPLTCRSSLVSSLRSLPGPS